MRRWLIVVALAGCGGGDPEATADAPPVDAPPPLDAPDPTVIESRSVMIGPWTFPPGAEATVCVVADLGNDAPRMIRRVRSELTDGTHHVIATLTTEPPQPTPTPCGAFAGGAPGAGVLTIAQQPHASLGYPAGSGLPIAAHQGVFLEMHYFNASAGPLAIGGTITLDLAAAASLQPVTLVFAGNGAPHIPAHGTATTTSEHSLPVGARLFATTAHTHQWGRRATVELVRGDGTITRLHDSDAWAERPLDQFAPITFTADDRLRLTCNYENLSDHDVSFGLSAEDEMCFLWAHHVAP